MKNALEQEQDTAIAVEVAPERRRKPKHETDEEHKREPNYHVIIWNDDVHTGDYVVLLLMKLFGHSEQRATEIMLEVDQAGKGVAVTCHKELAELKCEQILSFEPEFHKNASLGAMNATIEEA